VVFDDFKNISYEIHRFWVFVNKKLNWNFVHTCACSWCFLPWLCIRGSGCLLAFTGLKTHW